MSLFIDKAALRKLFVDRRRSLPAPLRRKASLAICDRLTALAAALDARVISCYLGFAEEVETDPFILGCLAAGRAVVAPAFHPGGTDLRFHRISDLGASLTVGDRGIRMPRTDMSDELPLSACDLVVVPGLAFTPEGHRLGYGRGCYDRSLSSGCTARTVGLAFEIQIIDCLPAEPHDVPVDLVITEERYYPLQAAAPGASDSHAATEVED